MKYLGMIIDNNSLIFPREYSDGLSIEILNAFNFGLVYEEFQKKSKIEFYLQKKSEKITLTIIGEKNNEKYFYKIKSKQERYEAIRNIGTRSIKRITHN